MSFSLPLHTLSSSLRQAARTSARRPGFFALASLTLAVGIGACAAVFALVDALLLSPPPYPQPQQLVVLGQADASQPWTRISPQQYQLLDGLPGVERRGGVFVPRDVNVAADGAIAPDLVSAWPVDAGFLDTLRLPLALGRNFERDEDRPDGAAAVILSHAFWQRRFQGDASVLGRSLRIDGEAMTVVGVLAPGLRLDSAPDLLLPLRLAPGSRDSGTNLLAIARLAEGASAAMAGAALEQRLQSHAAELGFSERYRLHFSATPLRDNLGAASRAALAMFAGCALCVLLLVAVNLSNLMLLRALALRHERAVRGALGASLLRQALPALAEGALIGIAGAVGGLLLAALALALGQAWLPPEWLGGAVVPLGLRSVGFALLAGVFVSLLAAALGAWRGRDLDLARDLAAGSRSGQSRAAQRFGRGLVVVQAALATVLLASSALLAHSLHQLSRVELGFDAGNVLTFRLNPDDDYADTAAVHSLTERLLARLRAEPGVVAATLASNLPIGEQLNVPMALDEAREAVHAPQFRIVEPGYFDAFGIPLRQGRGLLASDTAGSEPVLLVNEAFAREYLDGRALGRMLHIPMGEGMPVLRVVGVVADTRMFGPRQEAPPTAFMPLAQTPDALMRLLRQFMPLQVAVKLREQPMAHAETARAALRQVDPDLGLASLRLMARDVAQATASERINATLVGAFALAALVLAGVGLYSVTAVAVATRRREWALRAALGAAAPRLMRGVLWQGLRDVVFGLVLGLIGAVLAARMIEGFLFGVGRADPIALGATVAALLLAGLAATLAPALRVARAAPMDTLRSQT